MPIKPKAVVKAHAKTHTVLPHVQKFLDQITPIAIKVKTDWRVSIGALIAQGALESAWGKSAPGNAYFGIKGKAPTGKSVSFGTHEVEDGKTKAIVDQFRAYDSMADSADDYGRFLSTNKRYATCFAYSDQPELFIDQMAAAGYATDPDYAKKLKAIVRTYKLAELDTKNPVTPANP